MDRETRIKRLYFRSAHRGFHEAFLCGFGAAELSADSPLVEHDDGRQVRIAGDMLILDATAADVGGVAKVQFALTGGSLDQTVVGTAVPTLYGYLFELNTTTVPNGSYTLPRYAFIPHPMLQQLSSGRVGSPGFTSLA